MPATHITGAWMNPKISGMTYSSIFIASLTSDNIARATVENDIAAELAKRGIAAFKSMDEFPPGIRKDSLSREDILSRMRSKKANAILTVSVIRKETESRYVPGAYTPYESFLRYPFYADFWRYYSYWYPHFYEPGYYIKDEVYFIETNFYESSTEQLIW